MSKEDWENLRKARVEMYRASIKILGDPCGSVSIGPDGIKSTQYGVTTEVKFDATTPEKPPPSSGHIIAATLKRAARKRAWKELREAAAELDNLVEHCGSPETCEGTWCKAVERFKKAGSALEGIDDGGDL